MHLKRGQGMPLTVIVIAAILIILLVIMISIFFQKSSFASKTLTDCISKGGFCARKCSDDYASPDFDCPKEISQCCISVYEPKKAEILEGELFP